MVDTRRRTAAQRRRKVPTWKECAISRSLLSWILEGRHYKEFCEWLHTSRDVVVVE